MRPYSLVNAVHAVHAVLVVVSRFGAVSMGVKSLFIGMMLQMLLGMPVHVDTLTTVFGAPKVSQFKRRELLVVGGETQARRVAPSSALVFDGALANVHAQAGLLKAAADGTIVEIMTSELDWHPPCWGGRSIM